MWVSRQRFSSDGCSCVVIEPPRSNLVGQSNCFQYYARLLNTILRKKSGVGRRQRKSPKSIWRVQVANCLRAVTAFGDARNRCWEPACPRLTFFKTCRIGNLGRCLFCCLLAIKKMMNRSRGHWKWGTMKVTRRGQPWGRSQKSLGHWKKFRTK